MSPRSAATREILGYPVFAGGVTTCAETIAAWISQGGSCRWLACINPHSFAVAAKNGAFAEALRSADWLVPDGIGIVLASRFLGTSVGHRVTGSDIFSAVNQRLNTSGGRVFFLGSNNETLRAMAARMRGEYPNVIVAGTCAPPFKASFSSSDSDAMVAAVNAAAPDVLWVGLTSPKQDLWLRDHHHRLNVKFAAAVGAVFDFYAGGTQRAHPLLQRAGLEWLHRLVREPRRLWRRTVASGPVFVWATLRQRVAYRNRR